MTEESQEKNSLIKQKFLTEFFIKYANLVEFINSLPINMHCKQNAVIRLDEGMFWTREGIVNIQTIKEEKPLKSSKKKPKAKSK